MVGGLKWKRNLIMSKDKKKLNTIPDGFTLSMAVMDCLPVLFFSVGISVLSLRFDSMLFRIGAFMVILAGTLKVLWKFVLAIGKRDVFFLNRQMRYLMPAGFLILILSLIVDRRKWSVQDILISATGMPALLFWILGILGIICMVWFARHLNGRDAKANWKEQTVNSLSQFCFMVAILVG